MAIEGERMGIPRQHFSSQRQHSLNTNVFCSACAAGFLLGGPTILFGQISGMPDSTASAATVVLPTGSTSNKTFFTRNDLKLTALAAFGTALVSSYDKRIAHYAQTAS